MADEGTNPYRSPQIPPENQRGWIGLAYLRGVVRVLVMGLIGYVLFASTGLIYFVVAEILELDIFPSLRWVLQVGVVGAVLFGSSEAFNSGRGRAAGLLRRIVVVVGVFFISALADSILISHLGWEQRTYFEDPFWLHKLVLSLVNYFAILIAARVIWIGPLMNFGK